MDRKKLTPDELHAGVSTLHEDWTATEQALSRTVEFPTFLRAVEFISAMAAVAERLDHHPDLRLSWRTVELELSTHSAGGVTGSDVALATELDPLIADLVTAT